MSLAITQPSQIAAASPVRSTLPLTNTGSLAIDSLDVIGPLRNPAVANATTITFTSATTYNISDGVTTLTGQTYMAGTPISFNGWQLSMHGTPVTGDQVDIAPNTGGIGDNRNALALASLQTRALVGGGALGSAFASVVARIGAETQNAQSFSKAQDAILVRDKAGREIARGLSAYAAEDTARIKGRKSAEIEAILGYRGRDEIIHRDDLVLTETRG